MTDVAVEHEEGGEDETDADDQEVELEEKERNHQAAHPGMQVPNQPRHGHDERDVDDEADERGQCGRDDEHNAWKCCLAQQVSIAGDRRRSS